LILNRVAKDDHVIAEKADLLQERFTNHGLPRQMLSLHFKNTG